MSVEHRPVTGFGVLLDRDEIGLILKARGVGWDHDEPEYELQDLYPCKVEITGSAWSGEVAFLFYCETSRDPETGDTKNNSEHVAALKRMVEENKLDQGLAYHEEMYVY